MLVGITSPHLFFSQICTTEKTPFPEQMSWALKVTLVYILPLIVMILCAPQEKLQEEMLQKALFMSVPWCLILPKTEMHD